MTSPRSLSRPFSLLALGLAAALTIAACSTDVSAPRPPATSTAPAPEATADPTPSSVPETTREGVADPAATVGTASVPTGGGAAAAAVGAVQRLLERAGAPASDAVTVD